MRFQEILEACWAGYQQQGMKEKSGRMVPNCVPVSEQEMEEDLRKWFKEKWVRFGPDGKIRGACARGSDSEGKPKCLPQSKAYSLGKKGRASAAARKRREDPNAERHGQAINVNTKKKSNEGVTESATVTRIDSKPITDFASGLKAYKHTDDWSQSGVDTGDDSYWKNKNLKTNTTKGLFAGDPRRTALYATGNAHETRYVEFTQNGQPIVYFDKKDLPAMRNRKTYLTVFNASNFKQLPTGEWFSENPGKPIKQVPIGDPFKYIADQGWIVRVTDDLDKVFKQVKKMHQAGKIAQYGAEGMNESKQGVAEEQLDELMFKGSQCTKDCSGHKAGYEWQKRTGRVANSWSQSFNNGSAIAASGK